MGVLPVTFSCGPMKEETTLKVVLHKLKGEGITINQDLEGVLHKVEGVSINLIMEMRIL